ncbi:cyclase family protein [Aquimarina sp. BL5]|uniref:cyclase family protein n=1 Tax=Aquimarina sp. BL5 TaxID=1714860 RepID=UPI000E4D0674|nr:cyclase family protein [Aquimarina sp. BL5]AXT52404.1 cyclase family protein [Aquimarina sp. BL5]RKN10319.1 cyclase family protein [Aquimarina sp. BL5]
MITSIHYKNVTYKVDLSQPLDISIPLRATNENVNAWYIPAPKIEPVTDGDWIGKVSEGASTNFNSIYFNPHGHGTHTECIGHITKGFYSINQTLKQFFFTAELVTINPEKQGDDFVITKNQIKTALQANPKALIIRTLPNTEEKLSKQYSHTNWPYISKEAALYMREIEIDHLLIDLPSVDKEKDDGKLLAHKAFWNYPEAPRLEATITEMIFVKNEIPDGTYILNLQIASFENDASPSKPILYKTLKS